jgi:1-acyl-sn-glycerol-3-phosphate acyltransferase
MMLFLRSLAFNIVLFATGITLGLWSRFLIPEHKGPVGVTRMGQLWSRISLRALHSICHIDIQVEGREFLPQSGPALIAAQHQSAFDILVWLTLLPYPAYVLKQELVDIPLLGATLPKAGFIAVDRDGGAQSLRSMVTGCRKAVAAGRQIVIFPEGTRVPPGERGCIQPGIVALARALKLPVIPAATNSGSHWGKRAFKKYPGTVTVTLYPPAAEAMQREDLTRELEHRYYGDLVDNSVR